MGGGDEWDGGYGERGRLYEEGKGIREEDKWERSSDGKWGGMGIGGGTIAKLLDISQMICIKMSFFYCLHSLRKFQFNVIKRNEICAQRI